MLPSKYLKVSLLFIIIFAFALDESEAQWSIGATYENRQINPTNGFGIQLERDMKLPMPLLFIRTRAHYSYFNDSNNPSLDGIVYDDIISYDFGVAAIAGANIAMLSPYAGFGIGLEDYKRNGGESGYAPDENEWYFQAMAGLGLNLLPVLKPFIELRYSGFSEMEEISDSQQRLMIGVALRF